MLSFASNAAVHDTVRAAAKSVSGRRRGWIFSGLVGFVSMKNAVLKRLLANLAAYSSSLASMLLNLTVRTLRLSLIQMK